jgi:predicted PurR-regulated permease PerM
MSDTRPDLARSIFQMLFLGALILGCFWILRPFLLAMIWATTIVVSTWPLMLRLEAWLGGRRGWAVTVMTGALLLLLLAPLVVAVSTIAQHADRIVAGVKSLAAFSVPPPPSWLARIPLAGEMLATQWKEWAAVGVEGISASLAPYAGAVAGTFVTQIGNVGLMVVQFLLTVLICAILYATGDTAGRWVCRFARRLDEHRGEPSVVLAVQAIRAVALGVVVTALIQSAVAGIGLAIAGVPYPGVLASLIFILGVAQIGPAPVVIPAVIWKYWSGDSLWGTVLLVWSVPVLLLDNILRPWLIKRGAASLPLLLIFVGVIGGLIGFGIIGLFIGPVVLAVAYTLLSAWVTDGESGAVPSEADPRSEH